MRMAESALEAQWVEAEFATVDFGDERLANRFVDMAKCLASRPGKTIGQACQTRAAIKGAYRLFANDNFEADEFMSSHFCETSKRASDQDTILVVQDSSQICFNGHKKTKGLGGLNRKFTDHDKNIFLHPALALTTNGLPLGLVSYQTSTRVDRDNKGRDAQMRKRLSKKTSERESARWVNALDETIANVDIQNHRVVTIADREADAYSFMASVVDRKSHFLVRSKGDRNLLINGDKENICDLLDSRSPQKIITMEVPQNQNQPKRMVRASIKYLSATIVPPFTFRKVDVIDKHIPFVVWVVQIKEIETEEPLKWTLITNIPVKNETDALMMINWYKLRWSIESFFKILKSGCGVEECRLQSFEKLDRYIALMSIVAFRIFYLTHIARSAPDEKCTSILSDFEWKALHMRVNRTNRIPVQAPSIKTAIEMIGRLGGYLARKSDPPPGPIVIWRGWSVLSETLETLKILNGH